MKIVNFSNVKLQQLRIPAGWYIELNKFYHIDPDPSIEIENGPEGFGVFELFFEVSLFTARHIARRKFLDLGWYPMWESDGQYILEAFSYQESENTESSSEESQLNKELIFTFSTRSREELVEVLEKIMFALAIGKPIK